MHCSTRWTTTIAAAALIALPLAASAQTQPPSQPPPQETQPQPQPQQPQPQPQPQQPQPAQAQPQPAQPEPQAQTGQQPQPAQPADAKIDAAAAKQHLSQARDSLSQLTSMPEAARLQGEARTQVSQVISNFNELITTQADWRAAYAKVDANLTSLLGAEKPDQPAPAAGVAGAVGTSGATAIELDPAIRSKLTEFRTHLREFEVAAGSNGSGAMAPGAATGTTANPANPAPAAAGTSDVTPSSPAASMPAADQAKAAAQVDQSEATKHLDAISEILDKSKTGTLTKAQTTELKKHVAELRQLLQQSK